MDYNHKWVQIKESLKPKIHNFRESLFLLGRNKLTAAAMFILLAIILTALFAPYIIPYPEHIEDAVNMQEKFLEPSKEHLFGTDEMGRDIFSRTLYGSRVSLKTAIIAVALALIIGVPLGAIAGTIGGVLDEVIMRITDVFLSFPPLLLAIVFVSTMGPSLNNAIAAIALSWWPWYTRLVRGQAISLKERKFVQAAETIGTSRLKIIMRHIVPNTISPVIVQASMDMGGVILTVAALSFLGLGAQAPQPEWGLMINVSKNYFPDIWWYSVFPGLAIFITVLVFNLIGDGIREILDPKTRKK
ncbi:MAG: ABC transporter permease [Eubacteriales bacterium]|jgi:peptide/nickel transport system permease protein|nr:ABC transporter permease [Eubacteriales bacterium]MDD3537048.1 ABC transporter permease [Eubacteriales bacterium]HPF19604.1 ABC transporter permease [Bacillota bacterium]